METSHGIPEGGAVQPVYLLAESRLLCWKKNGRTALDKIRCHSARKLESVAYVGVSRSDDVPAIDEIVDVAMAEAGIRARRAIHTSLPPEDAEFLNRAQIVVLSGADSSRGWDVLVASRIHELLRRRYREGAVLIGISAGAVQMGRAAIFERDAVTSELIATLGVVPVIVEVDDAQREWVRLLGVIRLLGDSVHGLRVPRGGGFIWHPDRTIEPIRHSVFECWVEGERIRSGLIMRSTR